MAKVTGPLFSLEAHGDLAKLLNYHSRPSGAAVAVHHYPGSVVKAHAVPNASQALLRAYYKEAVEHWHLLSEAESQQWRDFVKGTYDPLILPDTATFYPDAAPEVSSVDGYVGFLAPGVPATWAAVRGGAGNYSDHEYWMNFIEVQAYNIEDKWNQISRSVVEFLVDLPEDAIIRSALLTVYGQLKMNSPGWDMSLNVYKGVSASNIELVDSDYYLNRLNTTPFSDPISYDDFIHSFGEPAPNEYVLNTAGLATIENGVVKFCFRLSVDVENSPPPWVSLGDCVFYFYMAEKGEGYKPKLVVTYEMPAFYPKRGAYDGYRCFMEQYVKNSLSGWLPWKLPDGSKW